jgi:photosystem II stability/assembly factor-like uncharacterized protein
LAIDPVNPNALYAATSGGMFKSTDGGGSWSQISNGLPRLDIIGPMVIDPVTPTTLYLGLTWGRVYRSITGGENWNTASAGLPIASVNALAIDPDDPNILYAGTSGGVFKTTNGGEIWTDANTGLPVSSVNCLAIDAVAPNTLYVGTSGGLFKSMDSGESWVNLTIPDVSLVNFLSVDPKASTILYAVTDKGVFKTTNGGKSWVQIDSELPTHSVNCLLIDPIVSTTLYAGSASGVFKSKDGGGNWSPLNAGLSCTDVRTLAIDPLTPEILYAGTDGGGVFVIKQAPIFSLSHPRDGEEISSCSCGDPPLFEWITDQEFRSIEIQFSSAADFSTISERVKGSAQVSQISISPSRWKKILLLPGEDGGTLYWKVAGERVDHTRMESNTFSLFVLGPERVGNSSISPTKKDSLPLLAWENSCNIRFKVWFGNDNQFTSSTKKASLSFNIKNPGESDGAISKGLTPGQWSAIKKLVGNESGSTLYWFVESWDGLKRYAKTEVMRFILEE